MHQVDGGSGCTIPRTNNQSLGFSITRRYKVVTYYSLKGVDELPLPAIRVIIPDLLGRDLRLGIEHPHP